MKKQMVKKQLSAAYRYSYARFALNYYTLYEMMCGENGIPAQAEEYLDTLNKLAEQMLQDISGLELLKQLREKVISQMEVLAAYTDCFQIYEYVLNRMERKFYKGVIITDTIEEFIEKLGKFLVSSQDSMILNERIQSIIGQLPVRYTKQKFYSMLMDGGRAYIGAEKQGLDNMMYLLRTEATVLVPDDMKTGYEDLYEMLEEMRHADYRNMTAEQYDSCSQKLVYASEKLFDDSGVYALLQDAINDLYVLFLTARHSMMEADEKQAMEKIVSGVLKEFRTGNTSMVEEDITELLHELEGIQEEAMERYLSCPGADHAQEGEEAELLRQTDLLLGSSPFVRLEKTEPKTGETDQAYFGTDNENIL